MHRRAYRNRRLRGDRRIGAHRRTLSDRWRRRYRWTHRNRRPGYYCGDEPGDPQPARSGRIRVRHAVAAQCAMAPQCGALQATRSEEQTSDLQYLMRTSYAFFSWKTKTPNIQKNTTNKTKNII